MFYSKFENLPRVKQWNAVVEVTLLISEDFHFLSVNFSEFLSLPLQLTILPLLNTTGLFKCKTNHHGPVKRQC